MGIGLSLCDFFARRKRKDEQTSKEQMNDEVTEKIILHLPLPSSQSPSHYLFPLVQNIWF